MIHKSIAYALTVLMVLGVANSCKSSPSPVSLDSSDPKQSKVARILTPTSFPKTSQVGAPSANTSLIQAKWGKNYDFAELMIDSDLIVEGTVNAILETRSLPPAEHPIIYTDYQLDISKILKSPPGFSKDSIALVHPGGSNGSIAQIYEGNEPFALGEQVILFLKDVSDDPIHTPEGKVKYSVLMNGGRFKINTDGMLDVSAKGNSVSNKYRGKNKTTLESDVLASLPDPSVYVQKALGAFLIVEGTVGKPTSRLVVQEDTESVFTVYPFKVEHVIYDALVQAQGSPRKTKVYSYTPVNDGDRITIFERGGTYKDITQRWAWSWGMKPRSRMLLFLGAFECGDKPIICTQEELDSDKAMYLAGGGERFLVAEDSTLTAVTKTFFGRLYDGRSKEQLERDLKEARAQLEAELGKKESTLTTIGPASAAASYNNPNTRTMI